MISDIIQKMQELAESGDGNYNYQVLKINKADENQENIMATFDCDYDTAKQVEGMLSSNFDLDKSQAAFTIAIKRVPK